MSKTQLKDTIISVFSILVGFGLAVGVYRLSTPPPKENITYISPITTQKKEITPFALDEAPKNTLRGTIATMSGVIDWQSRVATEPSQLLQTISIQQGEQLVASDDGNITVDFSIGRITLYPKTIVDVIQTLPIQFVFTQSKGTAQYSITGQTPFAIRSFQLLTLVRSGSVQLYIDTDSGLLTLRVLDGETTVSYNNKQFISQIIKLYRGDVFVFDTSRRQGYLQ